MLIKKIIPITSLLYVLASLINADSFGDPSLFSYFSYSIMGCFFAVLVGILIFSTNGFSFKVSFPVLIFLLLVLYIFLYGILTHSLGLTHYYWLINAILLLSVSNWVQNIDSEQILPLLFNGILFIAAVESLIVIMQFVHILPVTNKYFSTTGTWLNPNITAMFLALSLFSFALNNYKTIKNGTYSKRLAFILLPIILSAIVLLRCRTAYIISGIFIMTFCWQYIQNNRPQFAKLNTKFLAAFFIAVTFFFCFLISFHFKEASTNSRIQIWKNCLSLIAKKPLTGYGFGQFEKEYNSFVPKNDLPSNDHVNMPYNDFLELTVEGGMVAAVLWVAFLISLIYLHKNDINTIAVIASFIVIQFTNFGFQAIPAFAIFLLYIGLIQKDRVISYVPKKLENKNRELSFVSSPFKVSVIVAIICCILLCTKLLYLASAFHQTKTISGQYSSLEAVDEYESLSGTLYFSSSYHEKFADAFMQIKNYQSAKMQYQQALQSSSNPNVLGKYGWCYGLLGQYDSAAYYFKTIEKLQPYKFAPRMALLQLYQQKKDTGMIMHTAQEIITMPVKVESDEVDNIKQYAKRIIKNVPLNN